MIELPYFDYLFKRLSDGNQAAQIAFGKHVHWGYWQNPKSAKTDVTSFAKAADQLTETLFTMAGIDDDCSVLDVGCGMGGTIKMINQSYQNMYIEGVNIDERQIEWAKKNIKPKKKNIVKFVRANACDLPQKDNSYDIVFAIECIFHFSDRAAFLKEAHRVLKKDGRLVFCDFLPLKEVPWPLNTGVNVLEKLVTQFYGSNSKKFTKKGYCKLCEQIGFEQIEYQDATKQTQPTYEALLKLFEQSGNDFKPKIATQLMRMTQKLGLMRYGLFAFKKP